MVLTGQVRETVELIMAHGREDGWTTTSYTNIYDLEI